MYFITGGIGFLGCLIFMILVILFAVRRKPCTVPLIAMFLSVLLFLGSGFLYGRVAARPVEGGGVAALGDPVYLDGIPGDQDTVKGFLAAVVLPPLAVQVGGDGPVADQEFQEGAAAQVGVGPKTDFPPPPLSLLHFRGISYIV